MRKASPSTKDCRPPESSIASSPSVSAKRVPECQPITASSRAACCGASEVVDRAACGARLESASPFPRVSAPDDADESVGVAEIEKRRFQLGERFGEALEPIPRGAALGGRKRTFERRIRIDVANPGVDVADREAAEPGFETDRQPVAVLVVEHLVRLPRADPNSCHGKKGNTGSAMSYPRHLPPLPSMPAPRLRDDS